MEFRDCIIGRFGGDLNHRYLLVWKRRLEKMNEGKKVFEVIWCKQ